MKIKFDVKYRPQIESGEYKVEMRDGRPARIVYWEAKGCQPIIALFPSTVNAEEEVVLQLHADGQFSSDGVETMYDLFIVTPEEELTEFEKAVYDCAWGKVACKTEGESKEEYAKRHADTLLSIAREQLKPDINSMLESNYKTAYKEGYDEGRADALKDLPRWKKIGQGNNYSSEAEFCINGRYLEMNDTLNYLYEIALKDLEKLPKEDEK